MSNFRMPILLTFLIIVITVFASQQIDSAKLSLFADLITAVGSLLAVLWFTVSLYYQAQQLKEQRQQFTIEFKHIREDSKRNALLLAKDMLNNAELRALALNPEIQNITRLPAIYMNFSELKIINESTDPETVESALSIWLKKEGPAVVLLKGIKNASELYFTSIGKEDIDYSKTPEEFVSLYGPFIWILPYFEPYQFSATILSRTMISLTPARESAVIASFAALAKKYGSEYVKIPEIQESIIKHLQQGYPLPKIAENLSKTQPQD